MQILLAKGESIHVSMKLCFMKSHRKYVNI